MKLVLDTIILFAQDVDNLKEFYSDTLQLEVIEEIKSEWVLLSAGSCSIGLHRVGIEYRIAPDQNFKVDGNTKIVFEIDEDIVNLRERLLKNNVLLREIKTFDNYDFWICDGEDPEGNIFQLKQRKNS